MKKPMAIVPTAADYHRIIPNRIVANDIIGLYRPAFNTILFLNRK